VAEVHEAGDAVVQREPEREQRLDADDGGERDQVFGNWIYNPA